MDETTCMVDVARYFLSFTQDESCGKCVPCRMGTKQMLEILTNITQGKGREHDIDTLLTIAKTVKECSLCGLGQTCPNPVLTTLNYFRDEYEAHIKEKRCPAGVCNAFLKGYRVTEDCVGCGICVQECPNGAITLTGTEANRRAVILEGVCIQCGACVEACPSHAIKEVW